MNKTLGSDEEEDLESLRLAALQSLKNKNTFPDNLISNTINLESPPHFRNKGNRGKWGRFGSHQRPGKSGHFIRHRNTNLIPITPIGCDPDTGNEKKLNDPVGGSSVNSDPSTKETGCSKFNRYNKSDKSESESEDCEAALENNEPGTLKKSDSLEELMKELDDEIQGKIKEDMTSDAEKPKPKKNKKRKTVEQNSSDAHNQNEQLNKEGESAKNEENNNSDNKNISKCSEDGESSTKSNTDKTITKSGQRNTFIRKPYRSNSPNRIIPKKRRMYSNVVHSQPPMLFNPPNHFAHQIMPYMNPQNNPLFIHTNSHPPPMYFNRPLSPLAINTESLATATMAPLSPRSARFVLENKAIIERRKRSPRRSYSRSPSRSLSPRYSLSPPRRFRRSISPRRSSRSPRRFSPRKRSLSPRRRSISPKREIPVKPQPARPRISTKPTKTEENKPKEKEVTKIEEDKILDPVLLARKKKFETNEIKKKEGIIRLKPKEDTRKEDKPKDEQKEDKLIEDIPKEDKPKEDKPKEDKLQDPKPENKVLIKVESAAIKSTEKTVQKPKIQITKESKVVEDPLEFQELERLLKDENLLDEIEVPQKVADIFSDEESDSDNEGRFKMKQKRENIPVLSFSKLINGVKQEIKSEALPDSSRSNRRRDVKVRHRSFANNPERRQDQHKEKLPESRSKKQKITLVNDPKHSVDSRLENKIEIKLKNPSKYEKTEKNKKKVESSRDQSKSTYDVDDDVELEDEEIEFTSDKNDSGDEDNVVITQGDLRTQLSRKRAEKLHKTPAEEISSRILKFALQGAVFKKSKKKSKKKSHEEKLPIHLRLGINGPQNPFEELKVKKKSKKRKAREMMEQVLHVDKRQFVVLVEESD